MRKLPFDGKTLGLIVRGKYSHQHSPDLMAQHADVILADGSPIGFFGEGDAYSSGASGSRSSNKSGLNMKGVVFDYHDMNVHRPYYVDLEMARSKYKVVSTVLLLEVTKQAAALFSDYWAQLKANPKLFNILGYNCSTRASQAFIHAGVARSGIPGLDTPDNLYRQIFAIKGGMVSVYVGYLGFVPKSPGRGFDVFVDPL
jgi:hypothetical protein